MVHSLIQTINLIVPDLSELDAVCGNKLEVRADTKDTRAPESLDRHSLQTLLTDTKDTSAPESLDRH